MLNYPVEKPYDYDLVQAMWTLGKFPRDLLPDVAAEAMVDGHAGPAMLALVSFHPPELSGIDEAVAPAFLEMGRPPMARLKAAKMVTRYLARRVVAGRLDACEWCKEIGSYWWDNRENPDGRELGELHGLWLSFDEYPEARHKTLRDMMQKAREWASE